MAACRHAILIRHPPSVLASYAAKREAVGLDDIGFVQQEALFRAASDLAGRPPPVVDADAILADPPRMLGRLCAALGIRFSEAMLGWPSGPRPTDGIWASHWYGSVNASTGFSAPPGGLPELASRKLREIEAEALPIYERLAAEAIG